MWNDSQCSWVAPKLLFVHGLSCAQRKSLSVQALAYQIVPVLAGGLGKVSQAVS